MPYKRCKLRGRKKLGWKWGTQGKCYPTKAQAARQLRAIMANKR